MQPYEKATQELIKRRQAPLNFAKGATSLGSMALGAGSLGRLMPLLSKYVPVDIALKGLNKINPTFGKAIGVALNHGYSMEDVEQHFAKQLPGQEKEQSLAELNELGQFSPELQTYIEQQIQAGKSPDHAAASAMAEQDFFDLVRGIEKKVKAPFTKFVRELYEGKAVQQPQQQEQSQQGQGIDPAVAQILEQGKALLQRFKGA